MFPRKGLQGLFRAEEEGNAGGFSVDTKVGPLQMKEAPSQGLLPPCMCLEQSTQVSHPVAGFLEQ